jgi:ubiquinone/menaquinone biosynthesis C-methylase UbiE
VHSLDLLDQESSAAAAGIRYVRGNLDRGLPQFGDRTFDYVVCTEGLEHLEHPALLLREFARVLRPLGTLLVTTPNVVSLRSRLKFMLFGYFDGFRRRALFRSLGRRPDLETPHISPIHKAEFRTLLLSRPLLFSPTVILTAQRAERADGGAGAE